MPARLYVHVPEHAASVRILEDGTRSTIGRGPDCDVVIGHSSVSRHHAVLTNDALGWHVADTGSKNGLRFEGERVERHDLGRHNWFAVGDVYCELEILNEADRRAFELRAEQQRYSSHVWVERVAAAVSGAQLLADTLTAVVEITECRRGFMLLGDRTEQLSVRACYDLAPEDLAAAGFQGSRGAVERAMRDRRPVLLSAVVDQEWLRSQASVVGQGLRAVVCVPLEDDGELLGAVYADSDSVGRVLTQVDLEVLQTFAQRASTEIAQAKHRGLLDDVAHLMILGVNGASERGGVPPRWNGEQ